jgi:hypothetical protein
MPLCSPIHPWQYSRVLEADENSAHDRTGPASVGAESCMVVLLLIMMKPDQLQRRRRCRQKTKPLLRTQLTSYLVKKQGETRNQAHEGPTRRRAGPDE